MYEVSVTGITAGVRSDRGILSDAIDQEFAQSIDASNKWLAYQMYRARRDVDGKDPSEWIRLAELLKETEHLSEMFEPGVVID